MKKLIITTMLLFTVLPTFAEVGQQDHTDCSAISSAKDAKSVSPSSEADKSGGKAIKG